MKQEQNLDAAVAIVQGAPCIYCHTRVPTQRVSVYIGADVVPTSGTDMEVTKWTLQGVLSCAPCRVKKALFSVVEPVALLACWGGIAFLTWFIASIIGRQFDWERDAINLWGGIAGVVLGANLSLYLHKFVDRYRNRRLIEWLTAYADAGIHLPMSLGL